MGMECGRWREGEIHPSIHPWPPRNRVSNCCQWKIPLALPLIFVLVLLSPEVSNLIAPPQTDIGLSENIGLS